jgi:hypothetical protein
MNKPISRLKLKWTTKLNNNNRHRLKDFNPIEALSIENTEN